MMIGGMARRRWISLIIIAASAAITAVMSMVFYREVRIAMLATSVVCAITIERIVEYITRSYRRRLREAHHQLEQRVAERTAQLRAAHDELVARDRLATAGMLAAGVSHEIRSPLAVIRLAIDEATEKLAVSPPGQLRELARDISDAAHRIELIVRDLSSIARPVEDPLGPTDVAGAIASAVRLASYRFGKSIELERGDAMQLPPAHASPPRVVQVLLNLLINAARATADDRPNRIRITAAERDDRIVIAVSDTGTGMTDQTKARLFEPFFTTGSATGGTGLGLVVSRAIVERMGGSLVVVSHYGVGTTVEITLAIAKPANPPSRQFLTHMLRVP